MRFFGGLAGDKEFASALALIPWFSAAVWASCTGGILGPLRKAGAWVAGGLTRSQAHSLDKAILVVGLPPIFFFIGIAYFVYRRRQTWRDESSANAATDPDSSES